MLANELIKLTPKMRQSDINDENLQSARFYHNRDFNSFYEMYQGYQGSNIISLLSLPIRSMLKIDPSVSE